MRRRWYYFKRMLQADRLFVVQMIGNIIRMIQYAGRWIVLAVVCVAALYLGRGLCAGAWKDFYEKDRKSTRLNSSHSRKSRMPSSA